MASSIPPGHLQHSSFRIQTTTTLLSSSPIQHTETRPKLLETQHVHFRRTNPKKKQIKSFWTYWQGRKPDFDNLNIWWDKGKLKMKDICWKVSKNRAEAHKSQQKLLERELETRLSRAQKRTSDKFL